MPTYLYCVLERTDGDAPQVEAVRGIGEQPVRVLRTHALEAWVSTTPQSVVEPTVAAIKAHDAVVSAALATGRTPLPVRFGQTWPSDSACIASVETRASELEPVLRRVAGLVEMTVYTRFSGVQPARPVAPAAPSGARPGRAYLEGLRARADRERHLHTALEALRARVSAALGPLARDEIAEIRESDQALALSVSYLVERGGEARFRETVQHIANDAAARLVVAGPRAPYSFAPATQHAVRTAAVDSMDPR